MKTLFSETTPSSTKNPAATDLAHFILSTVNGNLIFQFLSSEGVSLLDTLIIPETKAWWIYLVRAVALQYGIRPAQIWNTLKPIFAKTQMKDSKDSEKEFFNEVFLTGLR